jgi:phosphoribosylanthranilate isomerase
VGAATHGLLKVLGAHPSKRFIFQWDGVNAGLPLAAHAYGLKAEALFDTSGGAGRRPAQWPGPAEQFPCGYAGGLGPENVAGQVAKITAVCQKPFWIDMERRVRTADDSRLDMAKVRAVLASCTPFISSHGIVEVAMRKQQEQPGVPSAGPLSESLR